MEIVLDTLVTLSLAYVGIRFPRYRKPMAVFFGLILAVVLLLRFHG